MQPAEDPREPADDDPAARPDPLADAPQRQLRRLARRVDRLRRRQPRGVADLAEQLGVDVRQLRLLADAWAEGGASGVQALGPAFPTPPAPMTAATEALERWRARHHPYESLRWDVWRNRVTVWWLTPDAERQDVERRPLLQLRLTHEGRWHLYHRASHGEWWPVVVNGPRQHQSVEDALEAVELDAANRFWSADAVAPPPLDG
jgi:hypothetical protein